MKKVFLSIALALTISAGMSLRAQLASFVLENFENNTVGFTEQVNINPGASFDVAIVDNPKKAGINTSNKVWEWKRYDTGDNQIWAGFYSQLKKSIPRGYAKITIKYLRKNSTSQMRINCIAGGNNEFLAEAPASKTDEWELLTFDLVKKDLHKSKITGLGLQPDFYTPIDAKAVVYIDDIEVIYDPSVVVEEEPVITLFDNSANNTYLDASWANVQAPSTLKAPEGKPGKIPCTTAVSRSGNALELTWKSASGGSWAAIATNNWKGKDLLDKNFLRLWIYSPSALAKKDLPQIYLEATSGNPNKTGKVKLGNYLNSDLAAKTWTEVFVPLADIWAANASFTNKESVKGVFFSQDQADNVEHTLYIDDIAYLKAKNSSVRSSKLEAISVYYSDNTLFAGNINGKVQIFDTTGRNIAEGELINGSFDVTLQKGIYFVSTQSGNAKIVVQ